MVTSSCILRDNTTFTYKSLRVPTSPTEKVVVEYSAWENTSAQRRRSLPTFLTLVIIKRARSVPWQRPWTQRSCLNGDTKLSHFMNIWEGVSWNTLAPLPMKQAWENISAKTEQLRVRKNRSGCIVHPRTRIPALASKPDNKATFNVNNTEIATLAACGGSSNLDNLCNIQRPCNTISMKSLCRTLSLVLSALCTQNSENSACALAHSLFGERFAS